MHIHILGVAGTFMSGVAVLAKSLGHHVSGSDLKIYPPMSTQLEKEGIELVEGYDPSSLLQAADLVIVGNVIRRGNPAMEWVLRHRVPFQSGPAWLLSAVLQQRRVIAVSGTHGKTTTTSMLAWILNEAGYDPGFLVGGIPENFGVSARLGKDPFFVIEADEYDTAFFDKRSKFIHYWPEVLILNNLEYDHADIFPDLSAIQTQFHHLIRTVSSHGYIIAPSQTPAIDAVFEMGLWTPTIRFGEGGDWQAKLLTSCGSTFEVYESGAPVATVTWHLLGQHNVNNALAAFAAAKAVGVDPLVTANALRSFQNVKRRMEVKGQQNGVTVYDDFAHHPTAIETTVAGLRAKVGPSARIIAVLELGSYTMRTGVHRDSLLPSLAQADVVVCRETSTDWGLRELLSQFSQPTALYATTDALVAGLVPQLRAGDHVLVMSNTGFDQIHEKLLQAINGMTHSGVLSSQ